MFQLYDLKSRAADYFKSRSVGQHSFKARSAARDSETDQVRIGTIFRSVETALKEAKAEQTGLKARVDDVLARAAVTMGNDSDEYNTRHTEDDRFQSAMNNEIANGQERLRQLETTIGHFRFLESVLMTRFPDFKP